MTPSWYEDHNIIGEGTGKWRKISERFRRQFHGGRAAGLDPRKMDVGFRQHPLHEEAAGDEFGGEVRRGATARNLVLSYLGHPRPHVAKGNEAEQLHVVGGGGARIVGF